MRKIVTLPFCPKLSIAITVVFVVSLLLSWFTFARSGLLWWDFEGQWLICRHIIEGVNPYLHTESNPFFVEGLSPVPLDYGTSPWGCITGMLFYPGFISLNYARLWFLFLAVLLYLSVAVYAYRKADADKRGYVILLSIFGTVAYWYSVRSGNAGSMICLLLISTVMLKDTHRYLASLCLALALVKPQVSLLICLYLLFDKKYISLLVAAFVNILAYVVVAIVLKTSPLILLQQFFACNIGGTDMYHGIMSLLSPTLFNYNVAMYASMIVGTIYVSLMYYFMKHKRQINDWRLSLPFFLASVFWCYSSWGNEYFILLPVCAMYYPYCMPQTTIFKLLLFVTLVYTCMFANPLLWISVPLIEPDILIPTAMFLGLTIVFTYLIINTKDCLHYTNS